nr:MAG TPA: hypothetical protein [Caudoviricetes sp.]
MTCPVRRILSRSTSEQRPSRKQYEQRAASPPVRHAAASAASGKLRTCTSLCRFPTGEGGTR